MTWNLYRWQIATKCNIGIFNSTVFSENSIMLVPISAFIGLPLYVAGPSALTLMSSLINQGSSETVLLAFLIMGKKPGVPVIVRLSTIIKMKDFVLYVDF